MNAKLRAKLKAGESIVDKLHAEMNAGTDNFQFPFAVGDMVTKGGDTAIVAYAAEWDPYLYSLIFIEQEDGKADYHEVAWTGANELELLKKATKETVELVLATKEDRDPVHDNDDDDN